MTDKKEVPTATPSKVEGSPSASAAALKASAEKIPRRGRGRPRKDGLPSGTVFPRSKQPGDSTGPSHAPSASDPETPTNPMAHMEVLANLPYDVLNIYLGPHWNMTPKERSENAALTAQVAENYAPWVKEWGVLTAWSVFNLSIILRGYVEFQKSKLATGGSPSDPRSGGIRENISTGQTTPPA